MYVVFFCRRVLSYTCVVTQEASVGSEINPQQLQMKTTHTNSQLIKLRVFVYFYNNSSVRGMGVGPALCVVHHGL